MQTLPKGGAAMEVCRVRSLPVSKQHTAVLCHVSSQMKAENELQTMTTQCRAFKTSRRIHAEVMLLYIIVCQYGCSEGVAETATGSTIKVKVGESITFPFSAEGNQSYTVDLLFNNTFKILKWIPQPFIHVREQYKGRVSIGNDSIWLNKLSLSDSGLYQVKIEYTSGSCKPPEYTYFHLQVFEPVPKPNITAECLGSNVSLSCFSSLGTSVTYSWETVPPCGNDSCVHLGQAIDLQLHSLSPSTTYTCTAHNPVSRATSDSVDLEMCFPQRSQVRWVPALCAASAFLAFGVLILLYKRKQHQQYKSETIQVEVDKPVMEEEPPSARPSIDPVCVCYMDQNKAKRFTLQRAM
ncbi:T-lymphocyte surface antigen Ly-9-like isoform X4 [Anguilla rostrata]|uniref:T-lymphocyte surface antigen Ly-9-like isoform X4 n=1 Tax=Anguilla rostrata TaxID=7938 RepID=UPI0030D546FE